MNITSFSFIVFVGISLFIYWLVPHRAQWMVLLADSLIFYFVTSKPYTYIYVLTSVLTVWSAALYISKTNSRGKRRLAMTATIILNVGILAALKYTNMFIGTFRHITGNSELKGVQWIAPLAISYYTLQLIAYLVDCCCGMFEPEKNPFKLLLYTTYFPLMVSGPICRYTQTGRQLFEEHRFDYERVLSGMRRALWGLLKKVVVADHVAMIADVMFNDTDLFSGPWVPISACVFMVQLYFDFSGCMDIVIGVSKCFGIILPENFNAPFLSRSVQEFWTRWHITLGAWFKGYVMFPISMTKRFQKAGKRIGGKWGKSGQKIPYYAAMFVVWSLIGIWHGTSWKYMIGQGWFFWTVIVFGQILKPVFRKIKAKFHIKDENIFWNAFQVVRTFFLVSIGNIAFRADSLAKTFYMYGRAFAWNGVQAQLIAIDEGIDGFGGWEALLAVGLIGLLQIVCDFRQYAGKDNQTLVTCKPLVIRWAVYLIAVFAVMIYSVSGEAAFIYFRF